MKIKMMSLALASAFAVNAGAVMAEDVQFDGSWYVMPGATYMHTDNELDSKDEVGFSLRLGKQLSEHWDIQIGGSQAEADEDSDLFNKGEYKQTVIGVDALYMLSRDNFRPFLLAGIGAARNDIDYKNNSTGDSVDDDKTSFMGNVGAGFQYLFNKNFGVQGDVRYVYSEAEYSGTVGGSKVSDSEWVGNTYVGLGVFFNFGGKVAAPVAVAAAEPVSNLPEIAPYDDGTYEFIVEETPAEEGPAAPAVKVTLAAEVLFDFDKAVLKDEGKSLLNTEVVEKMKAHPEAELVMVTGHTDRIGSDKYNQSLSERRANAVKDYIVSQGVEESRLKAAGMGEKNPVAECKGVRGKKLIECLQPNRRVVVETEVQRAVEPAAAE